LVKVLRSRRRRVLVVEEVGVSNDPPSAAVTGAKLERRSRKRRRSAYWSTVGSRLRFLLVPLSQTILRGDERGETVEEAAELGALDVVAVAAAEAAVSITSLVLWSAVPGSDGAAHTGRRSARASASSSFL
jgi:hypothetical protein